MPTARPGPQALIPVALLLGALASSAPAEPTHRVGLHLDWQAPIFLFDEEGRRKVGTETLEELQRLLQEGRFRGYPQWIPAEEETTYDAEWTVVLRQEEKTITSGSTELPAWKVFLEHSVQVGGKVVDLELPEEHSRLYEVGDIIPRKSPERLLRRIRETLKNQIEGGLLEAVNEKLIHELAIAERVVLDQERVIVPIRLAEYRASRDSLIGVKLRKNGGLHGLVVIKAASDVTDGEHLGRVWGRITTLEVPPVDVRENDLPAWWLDAVPQVFSDEYSQWVYMHAYWPSLSGGASSEGGSAWEPDP